jgi:4-hydroxybutyrate CoA-transferase
MSKHRTAFDALSLVQSNQRVFIHGGAATPHRLIEGLVEHRERLRNVEIIHIHTHGPGKYADPECAKAFRVANLFVGANIRPKIDYDRVDYLPCFLSECPKLFRSGVRAPDVALIHLTPPDAHGFCSLGTSVDVVPAAIEMAKVLIAQINPRMPRLQGDGIVHIDQLDAWIEVDEPIDDYKQGVPTAAETKIGQNVAELIEDGATIQAGIGTIPEAAMKALVHHKHLGIHTELLTEGMLDLLKAGAVDNSQKAVHRGKTVSGFIMGTRALYDYIDNNPTCLNLDVTFVNDPSVISRNPKVSAVNSAVEIDLTGQVCADSVGPRIISGVGGQMDFLRGAALSSGGKPIMAITSRTKKGVSRIVPMLTHGAGVVSTRPNIHWVVTEHGSVNLFGKTLRERARGLISIAHPDDREWLEREAFRVAREAGKNRGSD